VTFVRSPGADDVIDYHAPRFEETLHEIDMALDTIGGETRERSLGACCGGLPRWFRPLTGVAEQHGVRGVFFIVRGNRGQLDQISKLVDEGKLQPVIAEVLPLARAREAFGSRRHGPSRSHRQRSALLMDTLEI